MKRESAHARTLCALHNPHCKCQRLAPRSVGAAAARACGPKARASAGCRTAEGCIGLDGLEELRRAETRPDMHMHMRARS
jgi:hypothetical protein